MSFVALLAYSYPPPGIFFFRSKSKDQRVKTFDLRLQTSIIAVLPYRQTLRCYGIPQVVDPRLLKFGFSSRCAELVLSKNIFYSERTDDGRRKFRAKTFDLPLETYALRLFRLPRNKNPCGKKGTLLFS